MLKPREREGCVCVSFKLIGDYPTKIEAIESHGPKLLAVKASNGFKKFQAEALGGEGRRKTRSEISSTLGVKSTSWELAEGMWR